MAYITAAAAKTYLGITGTDQDTLIGYLITSMESLFNDLIGVDSLDETDYTGELVVGQGERYFFMKNIPVSAITKITDYESDIEYTGWSVDKIVDRIVYLDKSHSLDLDVLYEIDYTAGYDRTGDDLPEVVRTCIAYMIGGALGDKTKNPGIASYSILGKSVAFRNEAEYSICRDIINQYGAKFKKAKIRGI